MFTVGRFYFIFRQTLAKSLFQSLSSYIEGPRSSGHTGTRFWFHPTFFSNFIYNPHLTHCHTTLPTILQKSLLRNRKIMKKKLLVNNFIEETCHTSQETPTTSSAHIKNTEKATCVGHVTTSNQTTLFVHDPKSTLSVGIMRVPTYSSFRSISKFSKNLTIGNAQVSFEYKERWCHRSIWLKLRQGEIGGSKDFKRLVQARGGKQTGAPWRTLPLKNGLTVGKNQNINNQW